MRLARRAEEPAATPPQEPGAIAAAEAELEAAEGAERQARSEYQAAFDVERTLTREQREAAARRDTATTGDAALSALREFEALDRRLAEAQSVRRALERGLEVPISATRQARERLGSLRAEAGQFSQRERRQLQLIDTRRRDLAERERIASAAREGLAEAEGELERLRRRKAELLGAEAP